MLLDLNQIMSVIFNVPAAILSTIVASRAVRRLTNFTNQGPEVYGSSTHALPVHPTTQTRSQAGVHVQMETFTRSETDNGLKVDRGDRAAHRVSLRPGSHSPHSDAEKAASSWE